jgi:hypothetical protein
MDSIAVFIHMVDRHFTVETVHTKPTKMFHSNLYQNYFDTYNILKQTLHLLKNEMKRGISHFVNDLKVRTQTFDLFMLAHLSFQIVIVI